MLLKWSGLLCCFIVFCIYFLERKKSVGKHFIFEWQLFRSYRRGNDNSMDENKVTFYRQLEKKEWRRRARRTRTKEKNNKPAVIHQRKIDDSWLFSFFFKSCLCCMQQNKKTIVPWTSQHRLILFFHFLCLSTCAVGIKRITTGGSWIRYFSLLHYFFLYTRVMFQSDCICFCLVSNSRNHGQNGVPCPVLPQLLASLLASLHATY